MTRLLGYISSNLFPISIFPQASANEIIWVIRVGIFVVGALATVVGLTVESIYALFHLCSDLVFVILFPQLVGAIYIPSVNTYGSIAAYLVGLFLRITGGEELINFPPLIKYPGYKNDHQNFPFRTMSMICSFITLVVVSKIFNHLFDSGTLDESYDCLHVIARRKALAEKLWRQDKDTGIVPADDIPMKEKYAKYEESASHC